MGSLVEREFAEFFSGKAWIVLVVLPLFITFIFNVVYRNEERGKLKIAYFAALRPELRQILANPQLQLVNYPAAAAARKALAQNKLDGIIVPVLPSETRVDIIVNPANASRITSIIDNINVNIIRVYAKEGIPQFRLREAGSRTVLRWLSFPIWIIQIILALCLLQAASAVADEKEKQTFHSLMVSPLTFAEYLTVKLIWTTLVGLGAIWLTVVLTGSPVNFGPFTLISFLGCLVYSALAVAIGLLAPNPLFARTIATVTYLASAFPMMIQDLSFEGKFLLNIFPSFLTLRQLERSLLLKGPGWEGFLPAALILAAECLAITSLLHFILKKKADF